jgi:hypothetical protein
MMSREEINDRLNQKLIDHSHDIQQQGHLVNLVILQILLDIRELLMKPSGAGDK